MAWVTVKAGNVTKFDAGGSGDNVVSDGYIKSVEKIWMDSYTMAQTDTKTTVAIANLPANKKVTSINIQIETTASQTSHTVALGFSTDAAVDGLMAKADICHNLTLSTISLPGVIPGGGTVAAQYIQTGFKGFEKVTSGTMTTVALLLNNWTASSGTIKSVVRYT